MAKGPHNKSKQRDSGWEKKSTAPQGVTRFYRVSEAGVVAVRAPRGATVQVSSGKRRDLRAERIVEGNKMPLGPLRPKSGFVLVSERGKTSSITPPLPTPHRGYAEPRPEQLVLQQVLALVDRWRQDGQVTRVGDHHVITTDGLHDIEVTFFVPEDAWLEDRHHALYDRLAELERDTVLITPVIHPDRLARAD